MSSSTFIACPGHSTSRFWNFQRWNSWTQWKGLNIRGRQLEWCSGTYTWDKRNFTIGDIWIERGPRILRGRNSKRKSSSNFLGFILFLFNCIDPKFRPAYSFWIHGVHNKITRFSELLQLTWLRMSSRAQQACLDKNNYSWQTLGDMSYATWTPTNNTRGTFCKAIDHPWIPLTCLLLSLLCSLSVKGPTISLGSSFARQILVPPVDLQLELRRVQQIKLTVVVASLKKFAAQVAHFVIIVTIQSAVRQASFSTCSFRLLVNNASFYYSDADCNTQFFAAPQVSI